MHRCMCHVLQHLSLRIKEGFSDSLSKTALMHLLLKKQNQLPRLDFPPISIHRDISNCISILAHTMELFCRIGAIPLKRLF